MSSYNERERIWTGPIGPPLYNPSVSVGEAMLDAMRRNPQNIAQVMGAASLPKRIVN